MMNKCMHHSVQRSFIRLIKQLHKQHAVCMSTSTPSIEVSPSWGMIDEKVQIKVNGLTNGQKVTLHTYLEESSKCYGACGHFIADAEGTVDTFNAPSHGGTYEGIDPMGLFWSMKTTPGGKPGRLIKADVMKPYQVLVALQDGFREFDSVQWSNTPAALASCELQRSYCAPGVRRIPVEENGLIGILFVPPGEGPFPAVLDLFGLAGGVMDFRSALLASHGLAAFCLAYVAIGDLPKSQEDLDYNYFLKGFDWLASHPLIDSKVLGGISTCVGGGYLGIIAAKRPAMNCMVTINSTVAPMGKSQIVEDEVIEAVKFRPERLQATEGMLSFRDMIQEEDNQKLCPSWRHGVKHLTIIGLDDQNVNGPRLMKMFMSQIPQEFQANHTFVSYPGAGHLLEPPYTPLCCSNYNVIFNTNLIWGGEPKQHAKAQEESWPLILDFLHSNLRKNKPRSSTSSNSEQAT